MKTTLSVFVITLNEEKSIRRCLNSVAWVDEIIVVDGGSADHTVPICKEYTDKIYPNEFLDYSQQKNFALSKTTGDWVLSLDADEEITGDLRREITQLMGQPDTREGYTIPRRSVIFGRRFRFTGTQSDRPLRLFKKGKARFYQPIHEKVRLDGRVGALNAPMTHYTYDTVAQYLERLNRYTTREARWILQSSGPAGRIGQAVRAPLIFFKLYFLKQGIRDGFEGFLFSVFSAYYDFVKHAKARWLSERL